MIKTHKLKKSFGGRIVVDNLTFDAPDGCITGLLGSNGAGKSTTLRMICGALRPESGSVQVDKYSLGALLDHSGIYSRLTVRENLSYYGQLRCMPRETLETRIESVISTLGLESVADRRTTGFSQGERMKTALGRALLHSPQNLLLDEPTNGLDIPTIRSLRELLIRLRDSGVCIVYSSHVLAEVRALCDKVVVISNGSLIAQGSPDEVCAQTDTDSLEEAFVRLTC